APQCARRERGTAASRANVADSGPADDRSTGTPGGLRRSGVREGRDGVLPPPHLPPSDLASRADPVAARSQRARLSDDVGTQRIRGPRSLRYWDITDQLPAIKVPTLITGGKYDEIPPRIARTIRRGMRGSKLAIFPNSSHLPMWEERERYMQVVGEFLRRQDGR